MCYQSPTTATWQRLYSLATRIHALAPWSWMREDMIFGLQTSNYQEPSFVSVMGIAGEHRAVAVYLGLQGLREFRRLRDGARPPTIEEALEVPHLQASFEDRALLAPADLDIIERLGLSFHGPDTWPRFRSFRPGFHPWFVEDQEAILLADVLEQVLELAPRVRQDPTLLDRGSGNTVLMRTPVEDGDTVAWAEHTATMLLPSIPPHADPVDPALLTRLGRVPLGTHTAELALFTLPGRIQTGAERPRLAYTLLLVDAEAQQILAWELMEVETDFASLLARVPQQLGEMLAKVDKIPGKMHVDSPRLLSLVEEVATALGIQLRLEPELPVVEDVKEGFKRHMPTADASEESAGVAPPPATTERDSWPPGPGAPLDRHADPSTASAAEHPGAKRVGRNDPCPCGSGKKYKKCCLPRVTARADVLNPETLHQVATKAIDALGMHALRTCGKEFLVHAWDEFWLDEDEPYSDELLNGPFADLFLAWTLFFWIPAEGIDASPEEQFPSDGTIAAGYLNTVGHREGARTRQFIETARQSPLSFWQVEELDSGNGVLLRDMVTDQRCLLHDSGLSATAEDGDIAFLQVIELDGVAVSGAIGPFLLPPLEFRDIVEGALESVRARFRIHPSAYPALLLELDVDLVALYAACVEDLLGADVPEVRNSDGDIMEWCRSTYRFDPARRSELLAHLEHMRHIHRNEEYDEGESVGFQWMSPRRKDGSPQIHKAILMVGADLLTTEADSRPRERALHRRLIKIPGDLLSYQDTSRSPVDGQTLLDERLPMDLAAGAEPPAPGLDLDDLPAEAREELIEAISGKFLEWADAPVPALQGNTPREMMQTVAGRAKVEKLLNDWEKQNRRSASGPFKFDFNRLRRDLGLPER